MVESLYEHQHFVGKMGSVRQSRSLDIFICMLKIKEPIVIISSFLSSHWNWKSKVMPLLSSDPCFHSRNQFFREDSQTNFSQETPLDVLRGKGFCPVTFLKPLKNIELLPLLVSKKYFILVQCYSSFLS